jgi:hypothetical protein
MERSESTNEANESKFRAILVTSTTWWSKEIKERLVFGCMRQSTRIPKALVTGRSTVRTVLELPRRLMIYLLCWQHRVECPEFGHSAFSSLSKSEKERAPSLFFFGSKFS